MVVFVIFVIFQITDTLAAVIVAFKSSKYTHSPAPKFTPPLTKIVEFTPKHATTPPDMTSITSGIMGKLER
jgi:hypothetical protein